MPVKSLVRVENQMLLSFEIEIEKLKPQTTQITLFKPIN